MLKAEIRCDHCERDLTYTGNCVDWRLCLCNESIPSRPGGGAVTAMLIGPAIDHDCHFCGVRCLAAWVAEHYPTKSK